MEMAVMLFVISLSLSMAYHVSVQSSLNALRRLSRHKDREIVEVERKLNEASKGSSMCAYHLYWFLIFCVIIIVVVLLCVCAPVRINR